ncbi:hypothetical protein RhiirA5_362041, partial [Rhizophagus irregularis]
MASGRTKHVLSKRLGISYNETFHAHDANSGMKLGNKHMYRKAFSTRLYVHKPIKYLKYKQARVAPNANDY